MRQKKISQKRSGIRKCFIFRVELSRRALRYFGLLFERNNSNIGVPSIYIHVRITAQCAYRKFIQNVAI